MKREVEQRSSRISIELYFLRRHHHLPAYKTTNPSDYGLVEPSLTSLIP